MRIDFLFFWISCSFGLIQKNQKIKAATAKATNSHASRS